MDLTFVAERYAVGYLLQVLPCALVCLLPFASMMKTSFKHVLLRAALAIALSCVVFVLVSLTVFEGFVESRVALSNLLFIALLAVLFVLFWREVKANTASKLFVFLLAMAYGSVISLAVYALGMLFDLPKTPDAPHLYSVEKVGIFAVLDVLTLPLAWLIMTKVIRAMVEEQFDSRIYLRFCTIPVGLYVLLVLAYWLPSRLISSDDPERVLLIGVLVVGALALFVWAAVLFRDITRVREKYKGIQNRVAMLERQHQDQKALLTEKQACNSMDDTHNQSASKVIFKTPSRVLALEVPLIRYLEVFGHTLVIHLTDDRCERLGMSLAQARDLLPPDQFTFCHRSYLVNKSAVQSLRRYEITLTNGETVPVSKQRYHKVEEALHNS